MSTPLTFDVPGFTVSDDAAHSLIGQEPDFCAAGITLGKARVVGAHVTLDELRLDLDVPDSPLLDVLLQGLGKGRLPVSLAVTTYAAPEQSMGVTTVTYPATDPGEDDGE